MSFFFAFLILIPYLAQSEALTGTSLCNDQTVPNDLHLNEVHVARWGPKEQEPIVMGHGLGSSHATFLNIGSELSKEHDLITYDLRGHGKTIDKGTDMSIDRFSQDLSHLLKDLGVKKCHLLGASLSAKVVLRFAAQHPDAVQSIVFIDHEFLARTHRLQKDYQDMANRLEALPRDFLDIDSLKRALGSILPADEVDYLAKEKSTLDTQGRVVLTVRPWVNTRFRNQGNAEDMSADLDQLQARKVPALLIAADPSKNTDISSAGLAHMRAHFPDLNIHFVEAAGHSVHNEAPETTVKLLREFYRQHTIKAVP